VPPNAATVFMEMEGEASRVVYYVVVLQCLVLYVFWGGFSG
jgi:hypothetical protein